MMSWDRQITIKSRQEIEIMKEAGRINGEALSAAKAVIKPGVTTADLNAAAEEVLKKYGVYSPFKNYPGAYPYPASTCVSVNEELVHGIPGSRKLKEGDIVSVDCGTVYEGFVGDSTFTAGVGRISPLAQKLLDVTEKALYIGIEKWLPAITLVISDMRSSNLWKPLVFRSYVNIPVMVWAEECMKVRCCPIMANPVRVSS